MDSKPKYGLNAGMTPDPENLEDRLTKKIEERGLQTVDANEFYQGIQELYLNPSLQEVIEEELPQIDALDRGILARKGIAIPDDAEGYLRSLYLDKLGPEGMKGVYHSAKVYLRHIRFFLDECPDQVELENVLEELKQIMDGGFRQSEVCFAAYTLEKQ